MHRTGKRRCETVIKLIAAVLIWSLFIFDRSVAAVRSFGVGIVVPGDQFNSCVDGFKQGMKELGLIEGRDVNYLFESTSTDKPKLIEATKKLLGEKVNLIFTVTNTALAEVGRLAKPSKTPVVFGTAAG